MNDKALRFKWNNYRVTKKQTNVQNQNMEMKPVSFYEILIIILIKYIMVKMTKQVSKYYFPDTTYLTHLFYFFINIFSLSTSNFSSV